MDISSLTQIALTVLIYSVPIATAIIFHEVAHGYVAFLQGDNTAKQQGRLSLNPIKHIDPVGTIALPSILILTTGMMFGWAKAVPVNPNYFKSPRLGMAWVAIAGPLSNLVMAIAWLMLYKYYAAPQQLDWLTLMSTTGAFFNIVLMVFNLIPFPPLDGSKVLLAALPLRLSNQVEQYSPYGLLVLIVAFVVFDLGATIMPIMTTVADSLLKLV